MLSTISVGEKFDSNLGAVNGFKFRVIKFFVNYKEIEVALCNGPGQGIYRSL